MIPEIKKSDLIEVEKIYFHKQYERLVIETKDGKSYITGNTSSTGVTGSGGVFVLNVIEIKEKN